MSIESEDSMIEMSNGAPFSQVNDITLNIFRKRLKSISQIIQDWRVDIIHTLCDNTNQITVDRKIANNRNNEYRAADSIQRQNEAYLADEINQIQWYLYIYEQCTFIEIYQYLKWYYMRLGNLTHNITKHNVKHTLTEMINRDLLQISRSIFKTHFSLTDTSFRELKKIKI